MNTCLLNRRTLDTTALNTKEQEFDRFIDAHVIGQKKAKQAARRAYRRTLSQLRNGSQPFYVMLELGPTTCGKSELAYQLANFFHGNRHAVLKIDGSEYIDDSRLTSLIGASQQWVGFKDKSSPGYVAPKPDEKDPSAELSNHNLVWSRKGSKVPVTIVLIDEWEKACLEFNQILLSIFRDGKYTLGNGEVVDFSNCIFVLTANIGSAAVEEEENHVGIGFRAEKEEMTQERAEGIITKHLKSFAPPEFRARVEENGEIVIFEKLTDDEIGQICDLKVNELIGVVEHKAGIKVTVDTASRQWLLKKAGSVARVNGMVKSEITDVLDNELIKATIKKGDLVDVTVTGADAKQLDFTAGAQLVITDGTDPEAAALMAQFDAEMTAAQGNRRRRADEVDTDAVKNAASGAASGEGGSRKNGGMPEAFIAQPFAVTMMTKDDESLVALIKQLNQLMSNLKIERVATHTDHSVAVETPDGAAQVNITKIEVMAPVESMVSLKQAVPMLTIQALGFKL